MSRSASSSGAGSSTQPLYEDDNESKLTLTATAPGKTEQQEALPIPSLKIKRVDNYYSRWSKGWKYRVSALCFVCKSR